MEPPRPVPTTWLDNLRDRAAQSDAQRQRAAELESELGPIRERLEDRLRHIANMEASIFWKLRNVAHRTLGRR
jgi:hypothetical protein